MKKLLALVLLGLLATAASGRILNVPGQYATIQAAVDAAIINDTVLVAPGTYNETVTLQGPPIHLLSSGGADATTIQRMYSGSYSVMNVSNSSEVSGFNLKRWNGWYALPVVRIISGNPYFHHNVLYDNMEAICCFEIAGNTAPVLMHNTLIIYAGDADYAYGFDLLAASAQPVIVNNIVYAPPPYYGGGYSIHNPNGAIFTHSYNDFFGLILLGTTYGPGEITSDPLLGGTHLQSNSPCINAGANSLLDPDLTRSDIGCFYYLLNSGGMSLTLSPLNPPIQIPPGGGSFQFNVSVSNSSPNSALCQVWLDVTKPSGMQTSTVMGPVSMNFPAGFSGQQTNITQNVPANAPPGTYTYHCYIGTYPYHVLDQDAFTFEKLAGSGDCSGTEIWPSETFTFGPAESPLAVAVPAMKLALYPNPFNPTTTISYQLSAVSQVTLKIYDTTGRLVTTLVDGWREAGAHSVAFEGSNLPSGVYLARLQAGEFNATQKLVLMK